MISDIIQKIIGNDSQQDDQTNDLRELGEYHSDVIAPTQVYEQPTYSRVGEDFVKCIFVDGWPDMGKPMFTSGLFTYVKSRVDVSVHIEPKDMTRFSDYIDEKIQYKKEDQEDLRDTERRKIRKEKQKTLQNLQTIEKGINQGADAHDVSMYITIRGETRQEVSETTREIKRILEKDDIITATVRDRQLECFRSASPVRSDIMNRKSLMMSGATASMYPFVNNSFMEDNGVVYGSNVASGTPLIFDRFDRAKGYNQLTMGNIGSGKSFSVKLNILRTYASRDDVKIFIVDPLGGFGKFVEWLGGEHIEVNRQLTMNPMQLSDKEAELAEVYDELGMESPLKAKIGSTSEFLENFFYQQGVKYEDVKSYFGNVVRMTYNRAGIYEDQPETYKKESPTIKDIRDTIDYIKENPDELDIENERVVERMKDFKEITQPFGEGGSFEQFAKPTDDRLDFLGNEITYLDLSNFAETGDLGLMMQIMFDRAYNAAKETSKNVMFVFDEAHRMLQDSKSLDFLETAVRHSRHFNLSINFVTQTASEFFDNQSAETIAENTVIKQFQNIEGFSPTEQQKSALGMSNQEVNAVKGLKRGADEGDYSESIISVGDSGYMKVRIRPTEPEINIIDKEEDKKKEEKMRKALEGD